MAKAATTIVHNGKTYEPGDTLPAADFTKEEVKKLVAAGAVDMGKEGEDDKK